MEAFVIVIIIAVLVEALVEVLKGLVTEGTSVPAWLWPVCGAALGVLLCVLADVDALTLLGVGLSVPYVGNALTGILVSRGASFMHDVWQRVNGEKADGKTG